MLPVHLIADLFIAFFMFTGTQGAAVAPTYAAAATSCRTGGATTYADATMAGLKAGQALWRTYKVGSATSTEVRLMQDNRSRALGCDV